MTDTFEPLSPDDIDGIGKLLVRIVQNLHKEAQKRPVDNNKIRMMLTQIQDWVYIVQSHSIAQREKDTAA